MFYRPHQSRLRHVLSEKWGGQSEKWDELSRRQSLYNMMVVAAMLINNGADVQIPRCSRQVRRDTDSALLSTLQDEFCKRPVDSIAELPAKERAALRLLVTGRQEEVFGRAGPADSIPPHRPILIARNGDLAEVGPRDEGTSSLTVVNGTDFDAVFKLQSLETDGAVLMYVSANLNGEISNIAPGAYVAKFRIGKNWDRASSKFLTTERVQQFEDLLLFDEGESKSWDGRQSWSRTDAKITLHPVPEGRSLTRPIEASVS